MEPVKQQEKTLACVMHVASIPFPWMAPIVGILVSGQMPFVKHHSWKALKGQIVQVCIVGIIMAASLSHSIYNLYHQYQEGFKDFNLWAILIKSAAVWAGLALFGLWNTIASIIDAVRAINGQWGRRSKKSLASRNDL